MPNPKAFCLAPLLLVCGGTLLMAFGAREADKGPQPPPMYRDLNGGAAGAGAGTAGTAGAAGPENSAPRPGDAAPERIRVSGRVRLTGSSRQTNLVITGEQGEWYAGPQDQDKLMALQQRFVTVEGLLEVQEFSLLGGKRVSKRLILSDITVIHVE